VIDRSDVDAAVRTLSRIGSSDPVSKMRAAETDYRTAVADYRARWETAREAGARLPVLM